MSFIDRERRRAPRLIDTDWLVLSELSNVVADFAARTKPGTTALDFGCGAMPYADMFTERGATYQGADFGAGADLKIDGNGIIFAKDSTADLLLSFQVLEHVRDLDTYFSEAKRVLRPDGTMLLSTHGAWLYHPHPEDHRRWTREGLKHDIETRGFRVEEWRAVVGPLAWTTVFRLTGFAYVLRKIPLVGRPLAAALAVVMNIRATLEDRLTPRTYIDDNACIYVMLCRPKP